MLLKYQHDRQQNSTIEYTTALLLNSSATFEINGLVATITLTQSFLNNNETVEGLYAFALPENSAVNHLKIQLADRVI